MGARSSSTRLFLKGARGDFHHTGAIAPSSRFLARAITSNISAANGPMKVLEAGAGTGALTVAILRALAPGSHLDIYEVNPVFAAHLERSFVTNDRGVTVTVNNKRIQDLPEMEAYDAVVCGLPFNNFEPPVVKEILSTLVSALKPGGVISYFEYLLIRHLKSLATGRMEKRRLKSVGRVTSRFIRRHEFKRSAVLLNLPPAVVHHLRRTESSPAA